MLDKLQALNLPSVASKQKVKNVANKKKNRNLIKVSFFCWAVCVNSNSVVSVCICAFSFKTIHVTVNITNARRSVTVWVQNPCRAHEPCFRISKKINVDEL